MDFDLNIKNYTVQELEELLTLGHNYKIEDIGYKKDKLCMKIMNDGTLPFEMKAKIGEFFETASQMLYKVVNSSSKTVAHNYDEVSNFSDLKNSIVVIVYILIIYLFFK